MGLSPVAIHAPVVHAVRRTKQNTAVFGAFVRTTGILVLLLSALNLLMPTRARAWWWQGHEAITEAAIPALPEPLETFFAAHSGDVIAISGNEPPGTHYIDIDFYPEFTNNTFPRDIDDLIGLYGSSVVSQYGTGPWTAEDYYNTLVGQFATAADISDWTDLLSTAGALAHYIEDLHNPMHLTLNYNGQLTGQHGLHSRYEGTLINTRMAVGFQPGIDAISGVYYDSMIDAIFDDIYSVYSNNTTILAADLSAYAAAGDRSSSDYYEFLWDDGCDAFTPTVMDQAATMIAGAWYSAWRDAGFPQPPGIPPSTNVHVRIVSVGSTGDVVSVIGDAGQLITVQTSSNVLEWVDEATVTNLDGRMTVDLDSAGSIGPRFYRVVIPVSE